MSRFTIDQLPPHYAAQAQAQMRPKAPLPASPPTPTEKTPGKATAAKNRIRQNNVVLNRTEQAFLEFLKAHGWPTVLSQAITLRLGNGVRYTPDFVTVGPDEKAEAWETKGFMRDDAAVKLKVAASLYPWIKFHLVTRKKGEWIIQEVLP